jgi:hypothetical protein
MIDARDPKFMEAVIDNKIIHPTVQHRIQVFN